MEIYVQKTFTPRPPSIGALLTLALVAFTPITAAAEADLNHRNYEIYQSIKDVEIVDNVSCLPQKNLEVLILQNMQLSQNRAFTADSDEVAQGFRFDGAHHSEMIAPSTRSLAGG